MSKLLEYTLSLQDKMSGKLQQIGVTSDSALKVFSKLQTQTIQTDKAMSEMGKSVGSLQQRLSLLKSERDWIPASAIADIRKYNSEIKKVEAELNKLQTINGSKFKSLASDAINQMPGAGLIMNPLVAMGAGLGVITNLGIEAERSKVSFDVLLGSEEKSAKMLKEIGDYGATSPYEKMGLQEASKLMLSFGLSQDKILPNLKMIGDIAMGDANKMQSLTLAFSQVSSAGKLQGQDLQQMINAGFNPLQEISKMTGESMGTLREKMEKGAISAEMVDKAFEHATSKGGLFYNMSDKIGQTIGGKLSTAMDNLKELALKLFEVIGPVLSPALDVMSGILSVVGRALGYVVKAIKWFIDLLKDGNPVVWAAIAAITAYTVMLNAVTIAQAALSVAKSFGTLVTNIFTASWWKLNAAMLANPISWIVVGVVALIAAIGYVIYKTEGWATVWEGVTGFLTHSFNMFVEGFKLSWKLVENFFMTGIDKIMIAYYKFKESLGLGDSSANKAALAKIDTEAKERQRAFIENGKKGAAEFQESLKSLDKIKLTWNSDKKLSDITKDLKKELGMEPTNPALDPRIIKDDGKGDRKGSKDLESGIDSVVGGGKQTKNITINVGKLIEQLVINSQTLKEGVDDMQKQVEDALLRVLNSGNSLSNG